MNINNTLAYDQNSLNNYVNRIVSVDKKQYVHLNHCVDMHNGILVMDNIYFHYDSNQFDLFINIHTPSNSSKRKVELFDDYTGAFLKFIYGYKDRYGTKMKYKEFKNRFFKYLKDMKYETEKFTDEQFMILVREMFDFDKDFKPKSRFFINHSMMNQVINKNRHIFIDCNFTNLEDESVFSLVLHFKEILEQYRLSPYFFFNKDIIYHHPLLNEIVLNNNNGINNADMLLLTEYKDTNKYTHEILHFIKISKKVVMYEYGFQVPLESCGKNPFGVIDYFIPKQIRKFKDLNIQS